jgi:2-polyprenyl-3-methyl-5-hydroxy-6-metoxy-1,4-benzoquinol methylase
MDATGLAATPLATPSAFFAWCLKNIRDEQIPFGHYGHYMPDRASAAYLARSYDERMADVAALLRPGLRALEIGPGIGIDLHWAALQGVAVVGAEFDRGCVAAAHRLTEHVSAAFQRPLNIDMRRTNLLDMSGETFDLIFMKEVFHHLEPRDRIVSKLAELLAPGGTLVVIEPNAWNPLIQLQLFAYRRFNLISTTTDPETGEEFMYGNERIVTPGKLRRLFAGVGIDGTTRLFRILPTQLAAIGGLAKIASGLERAKVDAILAPACIHCVYRGTKHTADRRG